VEFQDGTILSAKATGATIPHSKQKHMKKTSLLTSVLFLLFACNPKNSSSDNSYVDSSSMTEDSGMTMPDSSTMMGDTSAMSMHMPMEMCVIMKDNKMMVMDSGKTMPMEMDITMDDGTKVMKDGHYVKPGGAKTAMKNGDCIMKDGSVTTVDKMKM
jgi:hypothetical protein